MNKTPVCRAIRVLKGEGMVLPEHGADRFVRDPEADPHREDPNHVGMMRVPLRVGRVPGRGHGEVLRSLAILENAERRMATTPWISELFQAEDGTEVLVQGATGFDSQGSPSLRRARLHRRVEQEVELSEDDHGGYRLPDVLAIKGVPAEEGRVEPVSAAGGAIQNAQASACPKTVAGVLSPRVHRDPGFRKPCRWIVHIGASRLLVAIRLV